MDTLKNFPKCCVTVVSRVELSELGRKVQKRTDEITVKVEIGTSVRRQ